MAKKDGRPFPLFSYVQRDAISSDVVFLERGADASKPFRFSHLTQQQACTNGSPARKESAAINSWHRLTFFSLAAAIDMGI